MRDEKDKGWIIKDEGKIEDNMEKEEKMELKKELKEEDNRVGIVENKGKGWNGGRVGEEDCERRLRSKEMKESIGKIKIEIVEIERIVLGVDKIEIGEGEDFEEVKEKESIKEMR